MDTNSIVSILISVVFLFLYLFSIYFMTGRGGYLIAGYHFQPTNKDAMKYHKYVMRRFGGYILLILIIIHILTISGILRVMPLCYTMIGLLPIVIISGLIYFNKSKKIKDALYKEKELDK